MFNNSNNNSCPTGTDRDRNGNCREFPSNDTGRGPGANRGW